MTGSVRCVCENKVRGVSLGHVRRGSECQARGFSVFPEGYLELTEMFKQKDIKELDKLFKK